MKKVCKTLVKSKYQYNAKLSYMDTDSFIVYIKTKNVYKEIANDVEERFDTLNYEINRKEIKTNT